MEKFGIREKKKAQLKVAILEEMLQLLRTKELSDISIEEICDSIQTTKVTFFNYFSYKEQVLDYFIMRWLYDRSFEIHNKLFKGREGILHLFQTICEDPLLGKKFMVSLTYYYSKLTERPPILEIKPYEYFLFNKDAYEENVTPLTLTEVFTYYLSQMETIKPDYSKVIAQLFALMYGVPIQTHIMELNDMYPFYEIGVQSILRET